MTCYVIPTGHVARFDGIDLVCDCGARKPHKWGSTWGPWTAPHPAVLRDVDATTPTGQETP